MKSLATLVTLDLCSRQIVGNESRTHFTLLGFKRVFSSGFSITYMYVKCMVIAKDEF